jgi:hypothetical protein
MKKTSANFIKIIMKYIKKMKDDYDTFCLLICGPKEDR